MTSRPVTIGLRHFRYFLAVFEELHFGRAAARLHMAQPPLSQAIRKLEDELGVQLLRRTSRVVRPTPAGQAFAEEARKVLAAFELAVAQTRRAGGSRPALRIGCSPALPMERMLQFVGALNERSPDTRTQVINLTMLDQVRRLRDGELELGLFPDVQEHPELECEPVFAGEPLAAYLAPEHALATRPVLGPGDLRDQEFVGFPRTMNPALHDRVLETLRDAGYALGAVHEVGGTELRDLLLAAVSESAIALLPAFLTASGEAEGVVVRLPLDPPVVLPETVLAWRRGSVPQFGVQLEAAREAAQTLRRESA